MCEEMRESLTWREGGAREVFEELEEGKSRVLRSEDGVEKLEQEKELSQYFANAFERRSNEKDLRFGRQASFVIGEKIHHTATMNSEKLQLQKSLLSEHVIYYPSH